MPTSELALSSAFEDLIRRASRTLAPDIRAALQRAAAQESDETARGVLETILERAESSRASGKALTSDPGLVTFFVRVGCGFPGISHLTDSLREAVARATRAGTLTEQCVELATGEDRSDNTGHGVPVVHLSFVPGASDCHVTVSLKGAGSEALTSLWMLPPSTRFDDIGPRIAKLIKDAGGKPCPPLIVGVGLGGTPEEAVKRSRIALLRPVGGPSPVEALRSYESTWKEAIDATGIGPMGLGGGSTTLAVHAEGCDRHRATFPVAVSVACWSDRRASLTMDAHGEVHV